MTYQPENIVWTSGNTPPAHSGGGGGGGGIVIPGNGNTTNVSGIITENDLPVARRVFAITEAELTIEGSQETTQAVLANAISSEIDGSYTLDTSPYEGTVFVIAADDYGTVWQPDTAYAVGDVIRPATFQGYVYFAHWQAPAEALNLSGGLKQIAVRVSEPHNFRQSHLADR